jgi:hypothetical protein
VEDCEDEGQAAEQSPQHNQKAVPEVNVAIVEWFPRVCGATDWALHLAAGGVVDKITFSKSGRSLKAWNRPEEWVVHKVKDAVEVLNRYDLVILSDVVCFAPQLVKRGREIPYYVDVLNQLTVPWTSMYHGGTYPSKYDDTMKAVFASPSFTGKLMTTRLPEAQARLANVVSRPIEFINYPFLPYDLTRGPYLNKAPPKRRTRKLLMTARIAVNKGQNAVIGLASQLAGDVELWGYNAFGLPSIGWRLWELGNALGYEVVVEAQLREDAAKSTHPRAKRFYTGRWEFKAGRRRVRYHRGYVHLNEVDWSPWVHVSLANNDFKGTLEYVTLDAMAANCVVIVPEHAIEYTRKRYGGAIITVPYVRCNLWAKSQDPAEGARGEIESHNASMITKTINAVLQADETWLHTQIRIQHEALCKLHDPRIVFQKLIRGVFK